MTTLREPDRMSDVDLKSFIERAIKDQIFTNYHLGPSSALLGLVFMSLSLSDPFEGLDTTKIGCIWEDISKAGPRAINGYPSFMSLHIMHQADWERVLPVIQAEKKRLATLEPLPATAVTP